MYIKLFTRGKNKISFTERGFGPNKEVGLRRQDDMQCTGAKVEMFLKHMCMYVVFVVYIVYVLYMYCIYWIMYIVHIVYISLDKEVGLDMTRPIFSAQRLKLKRTWARMHCSMCIRTCVASASRVCSNKLKRTCKGIQFTYLMCLHIRLNFKTENCSMCMGSCRMNHALQRFGRTCKSVQFTSDIMFVKTFTRPEFFGPKFYTKARELDSWQIHDKTAWISWNSQKVLKFTQCV